MSPEQQPDPLRSLADILGQSRLRSLGDIGKAGNLQPSPLQSFLMSLSSPPAPPVIQDRWFRGQIIYIDGYTFERCRFDGCQLVTSMATFAFRDCFIDPTCRILFTGPALKIVKLLMHDLAIKQRITPQPGEAGIFPIIKTDGTFTVE